MTEIDMARQHGHNMEVEFVNNKDAFSIGYKSFLAGYNKAKEWHNVAYGDLPKDSNKVVLCICGGGFINGKINYVCRLLTRKEFSLFGTVYYWKEIVLPELKEIE